MWKANEKGGERVKDDHNDEEKDNYEDKYV